MKSAALLGSLAVVGAENFVEGGTLSVTWSDCGDAATKGKVAGLTPSSLTLGQKTTLTGTGSVNEAVTGGSVAISLKASIISKTYSGDVCAAKTFALPLGMGSIVWEGMKCPLAVGTLSVPVDVTLSGALPASLASAEIKISGVATNGDKLLCLDVKTSPAVASFPPNYLLMWEHFQRTWPKVYAAAEGNKRFEIFKTNVDHISSENAKGHSHQLGVTKFADMTKEEFSKTYLGYKPELRKEGLKTFPWVAPIGTAPTSIDWVAKGAVTPVKNQGQCGSCWAFSTTGSVEGAYAVASGKLVSLSEEDLVQCDHNGDQGCQGGLMDNAFTWIQQKGGISAESAYPYTSGSGTTGTCNSGASGQEVVTVSGHTDVPSKDENALLQAVALQPVSVAIEADKSAFQLYKGGVLDSTGCGTKLDHGVLVVGYGTDSGKDYWKVKNSWGASWGEQGYLRMVRGKNMCGIAQQPSYPTGATAVSPTPGPSPGPSPPPAPPSPPSPPASSHYEDPKGGCQSGEVDITITGVAGSVCSPACDATGACPGDVPAGVTVKPQCALQDSATHKKYCALICSPASNDAQCSTNASCKSISGVGICTYDDDSSLVALASASGVKLKGSLPVEFKTEQIVV